MKSVAILLAIVGILALLCGGTHGDCCTTSLTLTYHVGVGSCGDTGGSHKKNACRVTICGDGNPRIGTWCGQGSCNIFGCHCPNGCLGGDWQRDFLEKNKDRNITIVNSKWHK